jgi:hypothetical protein
MNHAMFCDAVKRFHADVVAAGAPGDGETSQAIEWCSALLLSHAAQCRAADQFEIQYKAVGPVRLAELMNTSRETLRRKLNAIRATKSPQERAA